MASIFDRAIFKLKLLGSSALTILEAHGEAVAAGLFAAVMLCILVAINYAGGHPERIPMTVFYLGTWLLMFVLPVVLVWWHRRRQQLALNRVRSLYAVAAEWLMQGRVREVERRLRSIRRWEQHWRIGNSRFYRFAYSSFVVGATTLVAAVHQLVYAHVYSQTGYAQVPHKSLHDTVLYLMDHPIQVWGYGIFALLFGLRAIAHLKDLAGVPWSEFYGDRLEAALKAGRAVNEAPWHGTSLPQSNVSPRELLGLPEKFTSEQLRRAWLNLVRELHPDRWATAGDEVRRMKEAAMKRVNAARDDLAHEVSR